MDRYRPSSRLLLLVLPLFRMPGKGMDSHPMYPCAKLKLDQLFLQWLSLPESQTLVSSTCRICQVQCTLCCYEKLPVQLPCQHVT